MFAVGYYGGPLHEWVCGGIGVRVRVCMHLNMCLRERVWGERRGGEGGSACACTREWLPPLPVVKCARAVYTDGKWKTVRLRTPGVCTCAGAT